jgi:transcriptional regulator with XRE-family HTH domain
MVSNMILKYKEVIMLKEIIGNYVNKKRNDKGFSIGDLARESNVAEGTVKNVCLKKAENPSMETMIPIMDAIDGSFDEMLHPERYKERMTDDAVITLMSAIRETNGEHVHDIRTHYEQHRDDMKENYERRLSDKRELIDSYKEQIEILKKECKHSKIAFWICVIVFIAVLIAEVMNPNLGWFRY